MLTRTTQLLLSCTPQPGFVAALREADSVEPPILAKAHAILASKCNFPPTQLDALAAVTAQLQPAPADCAAQPAAAANGAADLGAVFAHVTEAEAAEPTPELLKRLEAAYGAAMVPSNPNPNPNPSPSPSPSPSPNPNQVRRWSLWPSTRWR